jgi:nucleoside-diphosphate-sugar epimerase
MSRSCPSTAFSRRSRFSSSHVIPALMRKLHAATLAGTSEVTLWRSGAPLREFLHVDDQADTLVFLLKGYSGEVAVNIGSGVKVTIRALAATIAGRRLRRRSRLRSVETRRRTAKTARQWASAPAGLESGAAAGKRIVPDHAHWIATTGQA